MIVTFAKRLTCVLAAAWLAGAAAHAQAPATGGSVTVGLEADVPTLDPIIDNTLSSFYVYENLFDQLTEIKPDGSVGPRLATSWKPNADATVWEYTIRTDAKFHDGSKLTPEDVIFTFQQVLSDPASRIKNYANGITGMEKIGDAGVRFKLSAGNVTFPRNTALVSIVPAAYYDKVKSKGFAEAPVGSGPFSFVSAQRGVNVVVKKNPDYWGAVAKLDRVTFTSIVTDDARISGIQSGSLDLVIVPPSQVPMLKSGGVDVRTVVSNQTMYLGFNTLSGPTANPMIRQAIGLAIDRDAISKSLLGGMATPVGQMSSPTAFGFDSRIPPGKYDPKLAKELLTKAAYDGKPVVLEYALEGKIPLGVEVAQAIGGYMEAIGLKVEMKGVDAATYRQLQNSKSFRGVYFSTFAPLNLDASIVIDFYIGPRAARYFKDDEVDRLVAAQYAAVDDAGRKALIGQLWSEIDKNFYFAPLYNTLYTFGVNPKLKWEPRSDGAFLMNAAQLSK